MDFTPECIPDDVLLRITEGTIEPKQFRRWQAHAADCAGCYLMLAECLRISGDAAGEASNEAEPPTDRKGGSRMRRAWRPPRRFAEYRLVKRLGQGAMGMVYVGHDTLLDRAVAIKFLAPKYTDDEARRRFLIEAKAIARMQHPNVVSIYRVGEVRGHPYIISELIKGTSLDQLPPALPTTQILALGADLARGLAAAHRHGVLHRDIKLANAILAEDGTAKLLDFGLAKLVGSLATGAPQMSADATDRDPDLTTTRTAVGTPLYFAPELWAGCPATPRTDIYALGALLFELCAGRPLRRERTIAELRRAAMTTLPPSLTAEVRGIDPRFAAVIEHCLQPRPELRLDSAEQLYLTLTQILSVRSELVLREGTPYRGLSVFEPEHRGLFFGRKVEVHTILELLRAEPLVTVSANSGAGKSSLCRAGVIPEVLAGALAEGRQWSCLSMLPGRHPRATLLAEFASRLQLVPQESTPSPEDMLSELCRKLGYRSGAVILIDQLEELVTQSDAEESLWFGTFLRLLTTRVPGVRVLTTVRIDVLGRLAESQHLHGMFQRGLFILRPLSDEGLREAIIGPAHAYGVAFESEGLIGTLAASMRQAQGGLPLLQFALGELWEARDHDRRIIPEAALIRIGGVQGALSRHADRVVGGLLLAQREAARRLLLRLVTPEGHRLRRTEFELGSDDEVHKVALEAMVAGRLLVTHEADDGSASYELAHEALALGWRTLRDWLADDAGQRKVLDRLRAAVVEWERLGRLRSGLWDERRLDEAIEAKLTNDDLLPQEAAFLEESRRSVQQQRYVRKRNLAILVGLVIVLSGALTGALWQSREAIRQKSIAELATQRERAEKAQALSRQPGFRIRALVASLDSILRSQQMGGPPLREAVAALTTASVHTASSVVLSHGGFVRDVSFSPDGTLAVTGGSDGKALVWETSTGRRIQELAGHSDVIAKSRFSPKGLLIATASQDGTARLWEPLNGSCRAVLRGHTDSILALAFSPDGRRLATGSRDGKVRVWDVETLRTTLQFDGNGRGLRSLAFSPDGTQLVGSGGDETVRIFDSYTGKLLVPIRGHTYGVLSVQFSQDGSHLLSAGEDRSVRIWDVPAGTQISRFDGHDGWVRSAAYSPDGRWFVSASLDRMARIVDVETKQVLTMLEGHTNGLFAATFSASGRHVATAGEDGTARIWDLTEGLASVPLTGHTDRVFGVDYSPDGVHLASGGYDKTARIWDLREALVERVLIGHDDWIRAVAYSPDGKQLATASEDGTVRLWETSTGTALRQLSVPGGRVKSVRFDHTGERLVTGSEDRRARLWDMSTGRVLRAFEGHTNEVRSAAFSPHDERLVTASYDGTARIWDVATGNPLVTLRGHTNEVRSAAFSPNGEQVVTASADRTAIIWDARTGRPLRVFGEHEGWVFSASYSPDGSQLLTASEDGTTRIWDVQSGRLLLPLGGHLGGVWSAAWSPTGDRVATAGYDHTVRIHLATLSGFIRFGCRVIQTMDEGAEIGPQCRH